jgi:hypothetical protein
MPPRRDDAEFGAVEARACGSGCPGRRMFLPIAAKTAEEVLMASKSMLRIAALAACLAVASMTGVVRADEVPLITGEHWTKSSEELKKVYLIGIANVAQVETAYQAGNAPSDAQSVVPRMVKGLKGQTLDSVREGLNRWYAAHPDQLQRPVIETLWFEMVVPGLKKPS